MIVDVLLGEQYRPEWPKSDLTDFSKLKVVDGQITYRLYQQDGRMQEMTCPDTHQNRLYVSWIQIHDRLKPVLSEVPA